MRKAMSRPKARARTLAYFSSHFEATALPMTTALILLGIVVAALVFLRDLMRWAHRVRHLGVMLFFLVLAILSLWIVMGK